MADEEEAEFDVIVIGGGPAGINTAIMCATRRLRVLLLEKNKVGGLLTSLYPNKTVPNYPGFPEGITAIELVRNWMQHLRYSGVTIKDEAAEKIEKTLAVTTSKRQYKAKAVTIATGTQPRRLGIPSETRFSQENKGVHYFPSHPEEFLGKKVVVVGGGDTAIDATLEILNLADEITLVHRHEGFRAFDENVEKIRKSGIVQLVLNAHVTDIKGRGKVEKVIVKQGDRKLEIDADAIIISIGLQPNNQIATSLGLKMDKNGFIITDNAQRTSMEGIFAVGDVCSCGLRLITVAAAHGAIASHHIYQYIKKPYWAKDA